MQQAMPLGIPRRPALRQLLSSLAAGLAAGLGLAGVRSAGAQPAPLWTASGGGVNVKLMPAPDGPTQVPLRESFSFDAHYAQCIVEDNPDAFAMDTYQMGRVVIEPHRFFMAMHSNQISLASVAMNAQGQRLARLVGDLGCATEAGTASVTVGSREVLEPAAFEIEAVDGGPGGGGAGDSFAFKVFFDPAEAPVNHAIFGPQVTFTGELVAGEVTIGAPIVRPPRS
jgi:hypothetical protein